MNRMPEKTLGASKDAPSPFPGKPEFGNQQTSALFAAAVVAIAARSSGSPLRSGCSGLAPTGDSHCDDVDQDQEYDNP